MQAADYIAFLSLYMKHSSILVYYQAVRFYHKLFGLLAPPLSHPYLKSVLAGVLNIPGAQPATKEPMTPGHLNLLIRKVNFDLDVHLLTWCAVVLMFRTLLRVSHVTDSPHTLLRKDLHVHGWGIILDIHSSKTMKKGGEVVALPVVKSPNSLLCPVYWVTYMLQRFPRDPDDPLLSCIKLPKFTYGMFSRVFKLLRNEAGLLGNFSSHSLRRGGATLMSNSGMTVQDIKVKGLWRSNAVQKYMVPSLESRKRIDEKFSLCVT